MNVWLISGEYPPARGGVADHTEQLAERLAGEGHEVTVLTTRAVGLADPQDEGSPRVPGKPLVLPFAQNWGFGAWRTLGQLARSQRPDVVHLQYQAAAYGMRLAANLLPWWLGRLGLPTITTMHDLRIPYLFPKAGPVRTWAIDRLLRDSAAVITTNSQDAAEAAARMAGFLPGLHLIPLTVQIPPCPPPGHDRASWRAHHGLDDGPVLAYFGLLNHTKGLETLFSAVALVRARGLPVRLLMAGEKVGASDPTNLAYRDWLRDLAGRLGITSALAWTGYLAPADLSAALLSADLAALPFTDGASYRRSSLLIVLAHGLPLVTTLGPASIPAEGFSASTVPSLPVLRDSEHCLLVPPGDVEALAAAILRVWGDTDLRERLRDGARAAASVFTWERVLAKTLELYRAVLERRRVA